jgi:hypothetical protein
MIGAHQRTLVAWRTPWIMVAVAVVVDDVSAWSPS